MPQLVMDSSSPKILFYDGECGLCQRSIAFLAGADRHKKLLFAPLNGETYKKYFASPSSMETVLYFNGSQLLSKSSAIIECLTDLGGIYLLAAILKIVPLFLRDRVYDFMARNRKKVSCPILIKDQRFLN